MKNEILRLADYIHEENPFTTVTPLAGGPVVSDLRLLGFHLARVVKHLPVIVSTCDRQGYLSCHLITDPSRLFDDHLSSTPDIFFASVIFDTDIAVHLSSRT